MKNLLTILMALVMLCTYVFAEDTDNASVAKLTFEANATTGFAWNAFIVGGDCVTLNGEKGEYVSAPNPGKANGVGGNTIYTLTAVKPGTAVITFDYRRDWEAESIKHCLILVNVDEEMNIFTEDITEYGELTGTVESVDETEHAVLLNTETIGEVIARIDEETELPVQDEHIVIYTNGTMTMSLPAIVNVLGWATVPSDLARVEEPAMPTFDDVTGIGYFLSGVTEENPIVSAYFTEGSYSPAPVEFTTEDAEEIAALVEAINGLEIADKSYMMVTDWYPYLVLTRADGTQWAVRFDAHMLDDGAGTYYELTGDDALWTLTGKLEAKYAQAE